MNGILLENAYESWREAIILCNKIFDGYFTFGIKKRFTSSLHNATELFLKQLMIDKNDYRVIDCKAKTKDGNPAKKYYSSNSLKEYLDKLSNDELSKIHSCQFSNLINFVSADKSENSIFDDCNRAKYKSSFSKPMKLLKDLRNDETHFAIDSTRFLKEDEFLQLHNYMVDFNEMLIEYNLLPYFGDGWDDCFSNFTYDNQRLDDFSYKSRLASSKDCKKILEYVCNRESECCVYDKSQLNSGYIKNECFVKKENWENISRDFWTSENFGQIRNNINFFDFYTMLKEMCIYSILLIKDESYESLNEDGEPIKTGMFQFVKNPEIEEDDDGNE